MTKHNSNHKTSHHPTLHSTNTTDDEFISKVAKTVEDACKLIDTGYEYVTEFQDQGVKIFRKRK